MALTFDEKKGQIGSSFPSLYSSFKDQEYNLGISTEIFSDVFTFSRNSEATYVDANGLIQTAAANEPRFTYDPVTGEPLGLLNEEQRANLFHHSKDFTQSSWSTLNATIESSAVLAPDGVSYAQKLQETTGTGTHYVLYTPSWVIGETRNTAIFVKAAERTQILINLFHATGDGEAAGFDLSSGQVILDSTKDSKAGIEPYRDGWYRVYCNGKNDTDTGTAISFRLYNDQGTTSYTGDGVSGLYIWQADLTAGSAPSSPIFTEASQVTRLADDCVRDPLSTEYNPNESTFFVEWWHDYPNDGLIRSIFKARRPSGITTWRTLGVEYLNNSTDIRIGFRDEEYGSVIHLANSPVASGLNRVAISVKSDGSYRYVHNGTVVASGTSSAPNLVATFLNEIEVITIGQGWRMGGGSELEGIRANRPISDVVYIPKILTEAELIALTTPDA